MSHAQVESPLPPSIFCRDRHINKGIKNWGRNFSFVQLPFPLPTFRLLPMWMTVLSFSDRWSLYCIYCPAGLPFTTGLSLHVRILEDIIKQIEMIANVQKYYGEKHSTFKLLQFFLTQLQLVNTFLILALKQTEKLSTKYRLIILRYTYMHTKYLCILL